MCDFLEIFWEKNQKLLTFLECQHVLSLSGHQDKEITLSEDFHWQLQGTNSHSLTLETLNANAAVDLSDYGGTSLESSTWVWFHSIGQPATLVFLKGFDLFKALCTKVVPPCLAMLNYDAENCEVNYQIVQNLKVIQYTQSFKFI